MRIRIRIKTSKLFRISNTLMVPLYLVHFNVAVRGPRLRKSHIQPTDGGHCLVHTEPARRHHRRRLLAAALCIAALGQDVLNGTLDVLDDGGVHGQVSLQVLQLGLQMLQLQLYK